MGGFRTLPGMTQIIGLSGYSAVGKDTAAEGLVADGWTRVAFADKLRQFALAIDPLIPVSGPYPEFPLTEQHVRLSTYVETLGWTKAKENPEVRSLLQRIGTDAGRKILGEDVWVDAAMRDLPEGNVVVTDVRFENEARAVKASGGHVVRIRRPGVGPANSHGSETALDSFDFDAVVVNDLEASAAGVRLRETAARLAGA